MSFTHLFKKTNQFVFLLRDSWHQSLMVRSIRPVLMRTAALPTCNTIWYGPLGAQRANASHVEALFLAIAAPREDCVSGCSHSLVKSQVQGALLILEIALIEAFTHTSSRRDASNLVSKLNVRRSGYRWDVRDVECYRGWGCCSAMSACMHLCVVGCLLGMT